MITEIKEITSLGHVDNFTDGEIQFFIKNYFPYVSNTGDFAKGMYAYKQFLEGKKVASKRIKAKKWNCFDYLSNDKSKSNFFYKGCYCEDGYQIVTNGQFLTKLKSTYKTDYEGKTIDKDNNILECQYPNYKRVIPTDKILMEKNPLFSLDSLKSYMGLTKAKSDSNLSNFVCKIGSFPSELDNTSDISILVSLTNLKRVKMFLESHGAENCKLYRSHARNNACSMVLECDDDLIVFMSLYPDYADDKAIYVYNPDTKLVDIVQPKKD